MAVPVINIELLQHFTPVLSFILVLVLIYAALQYTKALGANKIIHAILAIVVSFVVVLSPNITSIVMFAAPWFTILFILVIFALIGVKLFGVSDDSISSMMKNHAGLQWTFIIVIVIIILGALSTSFGQKQLELGQAGEQLVLTKQDPGGSTATGNYQTNLQRTIYHPKVLGLLFVLIVAALTVRLMSGKMTPDWPDRGGH
ncbi:hypothetical protein HYY69_02495 [Candidatus Woesearchaeota archaeon]|nr:hypothetical protein [Candidatus Woesearchaeota archaeon]